MTKEQENARAQDFSQHDREAMIAACWYVAYADGRLHREVKLMRSIADRLQIGQAVAQTIKKRVAAGKLKPIVHATFPLAEAAAAHRMMEASAHIGKILLLP